MKFKKEKKGLETQSLRALQFLYILEVVCEKSQTSSFNKEHQEMCNKIQNYTSTCP